MTNYEMRLGGTCQGQRVDDLGYMFLIEIVFPATCHGTQGTQNGSSVTWAGLWDRVTGGRAPCRLTGRCTIDGEDVPVQNQDSRNNLRRRQDLG
jgi:hypothetical protein